MHAVIDRQKNHGIHFRVLAKSLRLSGGDHLHSGTVVGKLEGERGITMGFVDLMREEYVEEDRGRGIYFTQDWASLPGVMPVASGGIHVWHMPALVEIFGDDSCFNSVVEPWVTLGVTHLVLLQTVLLLKLVFKLVTKVVTLLVKVETLSVKLANGLLNWLLLVNFGKKSSLNSKQWIPSKLGKG